MIVRFAYRLVRCTKEMIGLLPACHLKGMRLLSCARILASTDFSLLASLSNEWTRRRIPIDGFDIGIVLGFLFFALVPLLLANLLFDERWAKADRFMTAAVHVLAAIALVTLAIAGGSRIVYHWQNWRPSITTARATGHFLVILTYTTGCLWFARIHVLCACGRLP